MFKVLLYHYRKKITQSGKDVTCGQVTVTHTRNLCSAFNPSKCTHTHTHREHTPGTVGSYLCCSAQGAVGGSVPCSRVSPQSWYWGWRERCTFTPPTYNLCRAWDSNPQPLGYKSDSLSTRPRLPQHSHASSSSHAFQMICIRIFSRFFKLYVSGLRELFTQKLKLQNNKSSQKSF